MLAELLRREFLQLPWPPLVAVAVVISWPSRITRCRPRFLFKVSRWRRIPSGSLSPALPSVVSSPASLGVGLRVGPRGPTAPSAPLLCPLSSGRVVLLYLCFCFRDLFCLLPLPGGGSGMGGMWVWFLVCRFASLVSGLSVCWFASCRFLVCWFLV